MTKIADDRKMSRLVNNNKSVLQSNLDPACKETYLNDTENVRSRNRENRSCLLAEVTVVLK